jgi:PII-like signaling protein
MHLAGEAKLLRIFIGESDQVRHVPLYEVIVREALAAGLAGATAWKGLTGYGAGSRIRTAKILDLSADLPVVVEIADQEARIDAFLPRLSQLIEQAASGGLVTLEPVRVIRFVPGKGAETQA